MGVITVSLEDNIEMSLREIAANIYKNKKGFMSKAITEALQEWINNRKQKKIGEEMSQMMHKGFKMGEILYKKRDELWTR